MSLDLFSVHESVYKILGLLTFADSSAPFILGVFILVTALLVSEERLSGVLGTTWKASTVTNIL